MVLAKITFKGLFYPNPENLKSEKSRTIFKIIPIGIIEELRIITQALHLFSHSKKLSTYNA